MFRKLVTALWNEKIWIITLIAIIVKCILFLGFTLDKTVASSYFMQAFDMAVPKLPFYFGFTGVFLCFSFLLKSKGKLWSLIGFNTLVSVILLIDLWYYRGFSTMTTFHLLQQTTNLNNLSGSILSMIHGIDVVFILDLLLLIPLAIGYKSMGMGMKRSIPVFLAMFLASLSVIGYIPVKVNFFGYKDEKALFNMLDANITAYNLSPIGYHVLNTYSFIKDSRKVNLSSTQKQEIQDWFSKKEQNLPDNKYKGLFKGKNLIVIQLESFEQFVLNRSVNGQELTPNLNKLMNNSLNFTNLFEQVNQGTTSDAEFMLNTAIYPLRQGSTFFRYPYNSYNSLPKLLEKNGYSTTAIHSDHGSYWNWMLALSSIGFQDCIDSTAFQQDEAIGMGLSDGSYLRQLLPMLEKKKQPFYSFIVTLSNHAPFNLPKKYRELTLDKELDATTLGGYFQSVRYVDTQLGKFFEGLQANGMLDNSVVVLYGDHEGIHKYYQKEVNDVAAPEEGWLENHKHLPFIIYSKDLQPEEITAIGGQVDIMPTLCYLMGVDEKDLTRFTIGRNLLNTRQSFAVLKNADYIGEDTVKEQREHSIKGLEIADLIIRSNYFEK